MDPFTIVNDDGTEFDPPILPEYEALRKKYPPCKSGFDYKCMYCNVCLFGSYFRPNTEEDRIIIEKQRDAYNKYLLDRNPSIRALLNKKENKNVQMAD